MPHVTIKTGVLAADGHEIVLSEYLCDWPGCGNVAEHVVGVALDVASTYVVCPEHDAMLQKRARGSGTA